MCKCITIVHSTGSLYLVRQVTNGEKTFTVSENESTYIPTVVIHAIENPGKIPLQIIEIQSGAYLREDDIVRFADKYGLISDGESVLAGRC